MANLRLENELILAILNKQTTFDTLVQSGFDSSQFRFLGDVYDWLSDYERRYNNFPDLEFIRTKFPTFNPDGKEIHPVAELVDVIKNSDLEDKFNGIMQGAVNVVRQTGSVLKAREFLLGKLESLGDTSKPDVYDLTSDNFLIAELDYAKRRTAYMSQGHYGIPSGLGKEFDTHLNGGWNLGNMYGFVGKTGIGKTWIGLAAAALGALRNGADVFFLALESNIIRESYRLLTLSSGVENSRIQSGELEVGEFQNAQRYFREIAKEKDAKFYLGTFGERSEYNVSVLKSKIRRYKRPNKDLVVVIDYITLMSDGNKQSPEWQQYLELSKKLAILAASENIVIICTMQGALSDILEGDDVRAIAQSKGISRDFRGIYTISRVAGKEFLTKISSIKNTDTQDAFKAYYRTNWNLGKFEFQQFVEDGDDW